MNKKILSACLILVLTSLACGFNINIPQPAEPIPDVIDEINIPYPDADEISLKLSFGDGDLKLSSGATDLVEGTATYNYEEFKPKIESEAGKVEIKLLDSDFDTLPPLKNRKNEWDFKLGNQPMNLEINSGAYEGMFDFGGLSLTNLDINDGAADVTINFSSPNQSEMETFRYDTGASNVKIENLANANFSVFDFSSGAGDYTLDFSGEWQRDATVKIESGLSNIILIVPEGVNVIATVEGGALNVSADSSWNQDGNIYRKDGQGIKLTIVIEMGAGNLTLTD